MTVYFLLVIFLQDEVRIESYPTKPECEIRKEVIRVNHPGLSAKCIRMEIKRNV